MSLKQLSPFNQFKRASEPSKPRIIGLSKGEVATGKTSLWLQGPGPLVVFSLDEGLEYVVERYQDEKEIYVAEYKWHPTKELDQSEAIDLRNRFEEEYEYAIQHARTVNIDKEGDLWELYRYAEFGAPNTEKLNNYPALNQRYRRIINMPKSFDINFGLVQGMTGKWGSRVNPGTGKKQMFKTEERVPKGFEEVEGLVHMVMSHRREKHPTTGKSVFYTSIEKARGPGSSDVQDQTFTNITFPELATYVFPETTEEDWK